MIKFILNLTMALCVCQLFIICGTETDRADAIVVAEVISGQQIGSHASFTLRVDRALKGAINAGSVIIVQFDGARPTTGGGQLSGDYGMWFLRAASSGTWQLLPATHSSAPVPLGLACYPLPKGNGPSAATGASSPHDRVALELAAAAEKFPAGAQFYSVATGLLSLTATPTVTSQYRRLSQSTDPQVHLAGLIGLVRLGDAASLEELPRDAAAFRVLALNLEMVSAIRNVRDGALRTTQALGSLATSPAAARPMVLAAAQALAAIHTRECLPFLVSLLDSPDSQIRHQGLAGLSMFVENLPIQTADMIPSMTWLKPQGPTPYRTAETDRYSAKLGEPTARQAEYVAFWKAWWARMRDQLSARSNP